MKTYIYKDTKKNEILFTTDESDDCTITEADVKFEAATGIDPFKAMWVGCTIERIEKELGL